MMKFQTLIQLSILFLFLKPCVAVPNLAFTPVKTGISRPIQCQNNINHCITMLNQGKTCSILPVLPKSLAVPPAQGTYRLTLLREGVWAYDDGGYNSLILRRGKNIAVIDFPDSSNSNLPDGSYLLVKAIQEVLAESEIGRVIFVYSHSHYDHIGGAQKVYNWINANYRPFEFQVFGSEETLKVISHTKRKRAPKPTVIVRKFGGRASLGYGLDIVMKEVGGHTLKDLLIEIPAFETEKGIVMFVDVIFPGWTAPYNLALTVDIKLFLNAHKEILKRNFDIFVPGHIKLGTKADVQTSLEYTNDLLANANIALKSIRPQDLVNAGIGKVSNPKAPEFGNVWYAVLGVQRKLEIDACYKLMLRKWGCRLSGLDFTVRDHCREAILYNVIDV